MNSQLEAVEHRVGRVEDETVDIKQDLATAKQAEHKGLSAKWRHRHIAEGDDFLEDMGCRMTRVLLASTGECIGTAARIQQDGLSVSCRHVFVDIGGTFLSAKGWGEELELVASSPHDDIVFLRGPSGKHFQLAWRTILVGRPVLLAGFRAATDQDLPRQPEGQPEGQPMVTTGNICSIDRDLELAAATYQEAMPNSDGAPILDDTCSLRGVHIGTCYLSDEVDAQNQEGLAAPRIMETNVNQLWAEEVRPDQQPASSLNPSSSNLDAAPLAQHSCADIQHKASVDLLVPANRLCQMLEELE